MKAKKILRIKTYPFTSFLVNFFHEVQFFLSEKDNSHLSLMSDCSTNLFFDIKKVFTFCILRLKIIRPSGTLKVRFYFLLIVHVYLQKLVLETILRYKDDINFFKDNCLLI